MKLQYRPAALEDIKSSADYIKNTLKNPGAANSLKTKILQGASLLKENPYMGMALSKKFDGLDTDIRFITVSRQLIFYVPHEDFIEVIRVLDGRTDYLTHLFDSQS